MNTPPKKPTPNNTTVGHIQKPTWQNVVQRKPVAPPVYRPQPVPKVLQTKRSPGQGAQGQAPHPPIDRPQAKKGIPPKAMNRIRSLIQPMLISAVGNTRQWKELDEDPQFQNCTDFAFRGDFDLCFEPDLVKLIRKAEQKGYVSTTNPDEADIILYGRKGEYSHAIRKEQGKWYEVASLGGKKRVYTGDNAPPLMHSGDDIQHMFKEPGR